ncbi:excalibur calcium-binding domain-containing protein [Streptomyces sp. NPDC005813]|uniref:excalibur calcium-binding domain-containing protein n=1 Tax=Streptomyces sp. NPDC005813 TaxID=3155592 RepID=UPI0033EE99CB
MTNPYTTPQPPNAPPPDATPAGRTVPRWARKRYVLPALALAFFIGIAAGTGDPKKDDAKPASAKPRPTVTVTATATETADPEPAPTVTETRKVKVKVTVTAQAQADGATTGGGDGGGSSDDSSVYYANCTEARAAGAAPIHRGEPGYAAHLDRDGDGIGCDS